MWIKTESGNLLNSSYLKAIFVKKMSPKSYIVRAYGCAGDEYFLRQNVTLDEARACRAELLEKLNANGSNES